MKALILRLRKWDGAEWYAVHPCRLSERLVKVAGKREVELPEGLSVDKRAKSLVDRNGVAANLVAVGGLLIAPFPSGAVEICEKF